MSNHLISCAALVDGLPPSHKLLLLCLADDSRDGSGRIASPGMTVAMQWTGLKKSALNDAFSNLTERGLIAQHQRGQKHRNAEYLLFPKGCCDVHQRLDRQDLPGLSGTVHSDPQSTSSQGPADRTLSDSQGPVSDLSGSGFPVSASGPDRTPPLSLPNISHHHPVAEEAWQQVFNTRELLDEFCAELRTIRRERDQPTSRWTAQAIKAAIAKALDAGMRPTAVPAALRLVAADRATQLPGRLVVAGPWWDASEVQDLTSRRTARDDRAAQARASCTTCDRHGWVEQADGRVTHCPSCNPTSRSHTA